jgi:hypothetical protein
MLSKTKLKMKKIDYIIVILVLAFFSCNDSHKRFVQEMENSYVINLQFSKSLSDKSYDRLRYDYLRFPDDLKAIYDSANAIQNYANNFYTTSCKNIEDSAAIIKIDFFTLNNNFKKTLNRISNCIYPKYRKGFIENNYSSASCKENIRLTILRMQNDIALNRCVANNILYSLYHFEIDQRYIVKTHLNF